MSISGNMIGMYSTIGKTVIMTDSDGNEVTGLVTGQEVIFTANDDDVVVGKTFASDHGVSVGTMEVPLYTYALIDETGLCYEIRGTSKNCDGLEGYIAIPKYSTDYLGKYFNADNETFYLNTSSLDFSMLG